MKNGKKYTTLLSHGGAMIDEMLVLIERFDPDIEIDKWVDEIVSENVLGKATRAWTKEIITRYFLPRFVENEYGNTWKVLKILTSKNVDFSIIRTIMYYHTTKIDSFFYDFIVLDLFERYYSGERYISASEVAEFIKNAPSENFEKSWSDYLKGRLSRGVMSVLRDFGILEGKAKKKIADFYFPVEAFVYVAFLLHSSISSGEMILKHDDWKLFLLKPLNVERMFLEAHQRDFLIYNAAGNLIRIEFNYNSTEELACEIASRQT
ncbi:MAG: BrxA family protein [Candidatus Eremiobacterota bacterium]